MILGKAGNHALLDLAFFDHIARVGEERSKEPTTKSTKILSKIFTNQITLTLPPDGDKVTTNYFEVTLSVGCLEQANRI
jgi:hypothetical protein